MELKLAVSPRRVAWALILVALSITLMSVVAQYVHVSLGFKNSGGLSLFFVGEDESIPGWYSSITLLLCSVLLATISRAKKAAGERYLHWAGLSAIFLFLSVDEGIAIHENLKWLGRLMLEGSGLGTGGFIIRAWVVPGTVFVLIFALAYLRFIIALTPRIRGLFLLAGLIFVGGAIGMEMFSDLYASLYGGAPNMTFAQTVTRLGIAYVEELLEMLAIVVFIYALTLQLGAQAREVRLRVG
jgi:hypothetical protein